jgi:hypothetical protein
MKNRYTVMLFCLALLIGFALPTPAAEQRRFDVKPKSAFQSAEHRIALVIGNSSYTTGSLKNPVNDADDMASVLKGLGCDVILKKNAALQDMEDAIRDVDNRLMKGGVGLCFCADHGVQTCGKNFLLPVGASVVVYSF